MSDEWENRDEIFLNVAFVHVTGKSNNSSYYSIAIICLKIHQKHHCSPVWDCQSQV
jgi:hypothetical protein